MAKSNLVKQEKNMKKFCDFIEKGIKGYSRSDFPDFHHYLTRLIVSGCQELLETYNVHLSNSQKNYLEETIQHFYNSLPENRNKVMPNRYENAWRLMKSRFNKNRLTNYSVFKELNEKYINEIYNILAWQEQEFKKGWEMFLFFPIMLESMFYLIAL
jgi:hypothetical protein